MTVQAVSSCCFCGAPSRPDATCVANCWRSRMYCTICASGLGANGECLGKCSAVDVADRRVVQREESPVLLRLRLAVNLALPLLYETRETLVASFAVDGEISETDHPYAAQLVRDHDVAIDHCSRALLEGML